MTTVFDNLSPQCLECGNCGWDDGLIFFRNLFNFSIEMIAALVILMLVVGGIVLLISHGNDETKETGKRAVGASLRGMGAALLAWLLVNVVVMVFSGGTQDIFGKPWFSFTTPGKAPACVAVDVPTAPSAAMRGDTSRWNLSPSEIRYPEQQKRDASAELATVINCLYDNIPGGVVINSISDDHIYSGRCDLAQCNTVAKNGGICTARTSACYNDPSKCQHHCGSCHYGSGAAPGTGFSKAVDLNKGTSVTSVQLALDRCGNGAQIVPEGDHIHIETASCR